MTETTPSVPLQTAACPATWDLIEQLVQLESSKNRLHLEYMGKAMPADVYLRFQKLRDERIPALQVQLRAAIPSAPVCESVHTAEPGKQNIAAAQPIERALRKVLAAVQRYLPPDGISIDAAMSEIITAIDPWPGVGTSEAPDQPPPDFAHAYADQLMLRCLVPDESAPQAEPADALDKLDAERLRAFGIAAGNEDNVFQRALDTFRDPHDGESSLDYLRDTLDNAMAAAQKDSAA